MSRDYKPYSQQWIKKTLLTRGLRLSKNRGQSYLVDRNVAEKIVSFVPEDVTVLEVGSGLGALTLVMAEKRDVIAVEIDQGICDLFTEKASHPRVRLIHEDYLRFDMSLLGISSVYFVSNLPYSITGEAFRRFIEEDVFSEGVVMVQKELHERLNAKAGTRGFGVFTITCRTFLETELLMNITRTCFFPEPTVDSVLLRIRKKQSDLSQKEFRDFLLEAFKSKRKTARNNFKEAGFPLETLTQLGIPETARPEDIDAESWVKLFRLIKLTK